MPKLQKSEKAGFNAGENFYAKSMRLTDIIIDPEIANIFSIDENIKNEIRENIKKFNYDKNQPVVIWKGLNILVDGRTRFTASKEAGLIDIPVTEKDFESKEDAIMYTIERQIIRRNLTSSEIIKAVQMLPNKRKENDGTGRAVDHLAKRLKVSSSTCFQAKAIIKAAETAPQNDSKPAEILNDVKTGKIPIKRGYKELKQHQNPESVKDKELPENISFLKAAVSLLVEGGQRASAEMLINHFLKKKEKYGFYELLPEAVKAQLQRLPLVVR